MSQNFLGNTVPDPTSGAALISLLLAWQGALHSLHKGTDRPSYAQAGTAWLKEVSATDWRLMIYDGTDTDVQLGTLNPSTNTWAPTISANSITAAMLQANIIDGTKFVRGTAGHVWTAAGPSTDAGFAALPSVTDRVAKAGDTMTGQLTMSGVSSNIRARGTTAAETGVQLAGGQDFGGVFVRAVNVTSSGSGSGLADVTFSITNGVLTIAKSRGDFVINTGGGPG